MHDRAHGKTYKEKVHSAAAERGHKAKVVNDENLKPANVHLKHQQDEAKDTARNESKQANLKKQSLTHGMLHGAGVICMVQ
jgi:hypothetical protein